MCYVQCARYYVLCVACYLLCAVLCAMCYMLCYVLCSMIGKLLGFKSTRFTFLIPNKSDAQDDMHRQVNCTNIKGSPA